MDSQIPIASNPSTSRIKRNRADSPLGSSNKKATGSSSPPPASFSSITTSSPGSTLPPIRLLNISIEDSRVYRGCVVCKKYSGDSSDHKVACSKWRLFFITAPNQTPAQVAAVLNLFDIDSLVSINKPLQPALQQGSTLSDLTHLLLPVTPEDDELRTLQKTLSTRNVRVVNVSSIVKSAGSRSPQNLLSAPLSSNDVSHGPAMVPTAQPTVVVPSSVQQNAQPNSWKCEVCLSLTPGHNLLLCDGCEATVCLTCAGGKQAAELSNFFCVDCSKAVQQRLLEQQPATSSSHKSGPGSAAKRHKVGASSKYHGVSFYRKGNKWWSYIRLEGKIVHLGYFMTEIEAARNHDEHAIQHGKPLNFPKAAQRFSPDKKPAAKAPKTANSSSQKLATRRESSGAQTSDTPRSNKAASQSLITSGRTRQQERVIKQKSVTPKQAVTLANKLCNQADLIKLIPTIASLAPFTQREHRYIQLAFLEGLEKGNANPALYQRYFPSKATPNRTPKSSPESSPDEPSSTGSLTLSKHSEQLSEPSVDDSSIRRKIFVEESPVTPLKENCIQDIIQDLDIADDKCPPITEADEKEIIACLASPPQLTNAQKQSVRGEHLSPVL